MKTASKLFVLAAVLATSPLAARADRGEARRDDRYGDRHDDRYDDRHDGRYDDRNAPPRPVRPGDRWDDRRRDDRFERWCGHDRVRADRRYAPWRFAEWRDLRRDFWELELARDRFYAAGWHHPREVRRFERWYSWRRAELERRRDSLVLHVAWYR